jgi:hypothetical protein
LFEIFQHKHFVSSAAGYTFEKEEVKLGSAKYMIRRVCLKQKPCLLLALTASGMLRTKVKRNCCKYCVTV